MGTIVLTGLLSVLVLAQAPQGNVSSSDLDEPGVSTPMRNADASPARPQTPPREAKPEASAPIEPQAPPAPPRAAAPAQSAEPAQSTPDAAKRGRRGIAAFWMSLPGY